MVTNILTVNEATVNSALDVGLQGTCGNSIVLHVSVCFKQNKVFIKPYI